MKPSTFFSPGALIFSATLSVAPTAAAQILFMETFDTEAADTTAFDAAYPEFTTTVGSGREVTVSEGQAVITTSEGANILGQATVSGYAGEVTYSAEIGAIVSNGAYNVGMVIGDIRIVFHPGFSGGGAFRVERVGNANIIGNQDMGFIPANGVLHLLEVTQNAGGVEGAFEARLTDGENPSNVYTNSWNAPSAVGGAFGILRNGPAAGQVGIYDNLMATRPGADVQLRLSGFSYDPATGASEVNLTGTPSTRYQLSEADDLDFTNPDQAVMPLTSATVGTLDGNTVETDENGNATVQFNLGTEKPVTFIRGTEEPG